MKRINVMVNDMAKAILVDWKNRRGFTTLDDALEGVLLNFTNRTYQQGWIKKHRKCGGLIRYAENMDPSASQVFDMECLKCGEMVCGEEIEFERR